MFGHSKLKRILLYVCLLILIYILTVGIKKNEFFEITNKLINIRTTINNRIYHIVCVKRSDNNKTSIDCNDSIILLMEEADINTYIGTTKYKMWLNDFKTIKASSPDTFILSGFSVPVPVNENILYKTMINQHLLIKNKNLLCGDEISYGENINNNFQVELQFEQPKLKMKNNSTELYLGRSDETYVYNNKVYNRVGLYPKNSKNVLDFSMQQSKNN